MPTTDRLHLEIERFLQSSTPEALCITGAWGVGKTYAWNMVLRSTAVGPKGQRYNYSYVSLFGVSNLEMLKLSLYENLEGIGPPNTNFFATFYYGMRTRWSRWKKYLLLPAQAIPFGVGKAFEKAGPLYFAAIRNQIVCLDDLERKGSGLDIKDVFGLISFIRETRNCRVAVLLNQDELATPDREQFDIHFEKIFDRKLVFKPSPEEATDIAFANVDDEVTSQIKTNCVLLGISNIRVIKKIERLVKDILSSLLQLSPATKKQVIHSLTLFGWTKYQPAFAPPFEFYEDGMISRIIQTRDQPASPGEAAWDALLYRYNYRATDALDKALLKSVDADFIDVVEIQKAASEINSQIERQQKLNRITEAWEPLHASFDANIEYVLRSIVNGMIENIDAVSRSSLNDAVRMLRELKRPVEATQIIEAYFKNTSKDDPSLWDENSDSFFRGPIDDEIKSALAHFAPSVPSTVDIPSLVIDAAKTLSPTAMEQLAATSPDAYVNILKQLRGDKLNDVIYSFVEIRKIGNPSEPTAAFVKTFREALAQIAAESTLNAIRIRKFGVAPRSMESSFDAPDNGGENEDRNV